MKSQRKGKEQMDEIEEQYEEEIEEIVTATRPTSFTEPERVERAHASPRCAHVKPSGRRCGSPAMRDIDYCYYHRRVHIGPRLMYPTLTMLEDAHGVQAALMEVLCGILDGSLTDKHAALLLYGLQTAASNLKRVEDVDPDEVAVEAPPAEKLPEGVFQTKRDEWSSQEKIAIRDFMQDMEVKKLWRMSREAQNDQAWQAHLKRTAEEERVES